MNTYTSDISFAFLVFPFVAALLVLPYTLYQYHRYGAVSIWKTFVAFSFIFYMLCAIFLVLMPLPADRSIYIPSTQEPQLVPFHTLIEIYQTSDFQLSDPSTWFDTLREPLVYTTLFNILLTMPLGFYFCYLFHLRWWQALLLGLATTLLFETTQYTGIFGIYEHPYRYADIDDVITNTLGTMLGFWLAIPIGHLLPDLTRTDQRSEEKGRSRITVTRRFVAFLVDIIILVVLVFLGELALGTLDGPDLSDGPSIGQEALDALLQGGEGNESTALSDTEATMASVWAWLKATLRLSLNDPAEVLLVLTGAMLIVFVIIPVITRGRTIGQAFTKIKIVTSDGERPPWYRYVLRYGTLWVMLVIPAVVVVFFPENGVSGIGFRSIVRLVGVYYGLWFLTLLVRALWAGIGSHAHGTGHRFVVLSDIISQTTLVPASSR